MYKNENGKTVNRLNGIESVDIINETPNIPEGLAIVGDKVLIGSTESKKVIEQLEGQFGIVVARIRDYEIMRVKLITGEEYDLSQENLIPIRGNNQSAKAEDIINNPSHYCFGKYEPVKVIQDWDLDFCLGNVIKYIARAGKKDGNSTLQDLRKAKKYLEFEIERLEGE